MSFTFNKAIVGGLGTFLGTFDWSALANVDWNTAIHTGLTQGWKSAAFGLLVGFLTYKTPNKEKKVAAAGQKIDGLK